jgi:hypothetical protein
VLRLLWYVALVMSQGNQQFELEATVTKGTQRRTYLPGIVGVRHGHLEQAPGPCVVCAGSRLSSDLCTTLLQYSIEQRIVSIWIFTLPVGPLLPFVGPLSDTNSNALTCCRLGRCLLRWLFDFLSESLRAVGAAGQMTDRPVCCEYLRGGGFAIQPLAGLCRPRSALCTCCCISKG